MQRSDLEREIGVVDQDIDCAELSLGSLDHVFDLIRACHVGLKGHAAAAAVVDFAQNFLSSFSVLVVVDDHCSALLRQTNRSGRANTSARSGHEGNSSLQRPRVRWLRHAGNKASG